MGLRKNEVIVLGTLHAQHLKSEEYSLSELKAIIKCISPDIVLAEMPPKKYETAIQEYRETGSIKEPRILQYPEFSEVIIPLSQKGDFTIVPVSAWTQEMADAREKKLTELSEDIAREDEWNEYLDARELVGYIFDTKARGFDPTWVNSDAFDEILELELSVFNTLFNDDLGAGGWQNINESHYALITEALKKYEGKSLRILITFGAGHKGWLRNKLATRDDIKLLDLLDTLNCYPTK